MILPTLLALSQIATGQTFACRPVSVHDGDTFRCADGTRIRIAGVDSPDFESASPCRQRRANVVCDNVKANRARLVTTRLVEGKTLKCHAAGRSYNRVVARCWLPDNRSLSCAIIAGGGGVRLDGFWRRYGMGFCDAK